MKEVFKDVPNYEGLYQVSNLGRVKSLHSVERILKQSISKTGYYVVLLCKKPTRIMFKVHQLVAMAFLNHKPCGHKLVINHKNNNPLDNSVDNLEITTQRENCHTHHKGSSKYKGVFLHKPSNKWIAQISINGIKKHLGIFVNELEASNAYQTKLKTIL